LVLVQRRGGRFYEEPEEMDRRADALASIVNDSRGEPVARVERPFTRLFPLDGAYIGYGYFAGHLPRSQPVLVVAEGRVNRPVLIRFDTEGHMLGEEQIDLSEKLAQRPAHLSQEVNEEELLELRHRELGLEPGPIFVREFDSELAVTDLRDNIDAEYIHHEEACAHDYWLWSTRQFAMDGGTRWLDGLGRVHST
jgi:hypothetical protein